MDEDKSNIINIGLIREMIYEQSALGKEPTRIELPEIIRRRVRGDIELFGLKVIWGESLRIIAHRSLYGKRYG